MFKSTRFSRAPKKASYDSEKGRGELFDLMAEFAKYGFQ